MLNYRRARFEGGYYFFTVLTHRRRKLFLDSSARDCLREVWQKVRKNRPFEITAMCLLPEHIHFNPVKHNLVDATGDWPWSNYHKYIKQGDYNHRLLNDIDGDFGEI